MVSCVYRHCRRALLASCQQENRKLELGIYVRQFLQYRFASDLTNDQNKLHAFITTPSEKLSSASPQNNSSTIRNNAKINPWATASAAAAALGADARKVKRTDDTSNANVSADDKSNVNFIPRLTKASPAFAEGGNSYRKEKIAGFDPRDNVDNRFPATSHEHAAVEPSAFTDNSYVTQLRAMSEYLLKAADLKECRIAYRRSPYSDKTEPVAVYWRRDVEQRAVEVWGSLDALQREKASRKRRNDQQQRQLSTLKKALRTYNTLKSYMQGHPVAAGGGGSSPGGVDLSAAQKRSLEATHSIVKSAILVNGLNTILKFFAWMFTNSHAMFAEMVHSFADFLNQIVLYIGIVESSRKPDLHHPYGYTQLRHVYALISGVGIFFFGGGVNIYHGIHGLMAAPEIMPLGWAFATLLFGLVSESYVLLRAIHEIRNSARQLNVTFGNFIRRGCDPQTTIVFLEDTAAVAGVIIAGTCVTLTHFTQSHLFDCAGSIAVGALLAVVSGVVIRANSSALVGRSIPEDAEIAITRDLESDHIIRAVYDVKTVDMGGYNVRYKAEVDIDGREVTRSYLERQDLESLMSDARKIATIDDLETFMLKHGENIVDMLGAEVDRIEANLRKKHPLVRHIDLEVL